MVPDQHFNKPGKSPFMDMALVPRYEGDPPGEAGVRIDPGAAQNLGVRLATVERTSFAREVNAAGVLAFNGRNLAIVQSRTGGFVDRTYRRAIGDVVPAGAAIVDLRVPEWAAAQGEYLAVRKGGDPAIAAASRKRLTMLGMPEALITHVESEGAPRPIFTVVAPIAGAITALDVREGMTLNSGAAVATISGMSPIWLVVSLPQANAALATPGAAVTARLPAFPGESFSGRVETVLPAADPTSRAIEVRIAMPNPKGRLRAGLTAQVMLTDRGAKPVLVIPAEAVIRTGQRNIVITALANGRFAPVEVELGSESGDKVEITRGLSEGQRVVASGQFLIDSEASLSGVVARMQSGSASPAQAQSYQTVGRITAVNAEGVTFAHEAVPALSWPAMTMQFSLATPGLAKGFSVGDQVSFRFHQGGAGYVVDEIHKTGAPK
jgi:Cu(I)/Ag(I) efflux system membrane fusion protein